MLLILGCYIALVWLLFGRLKLLKLGWLSGGATIAIGAAILAVFLALFNYLTPSGRVTVISRVVEVTPNVSGQIVQIPVSTNVIVKTGDVLFQIDPVPFSNKVRQLEAALSQAKQQVKQLASNYEQATANVQALAAQLAYNQQRAADMQKLTSQAAQSVFRMQDASSQAQTVAYQLDSARAAQATAKLAMDSEIGGVNTSVAQVEAQLAQARWELAQTTVRAPADGYVTVMALAVGDRALPARSVLSFIPADGVTLVGMFPPNGFETIKPDAKVSIVFDDRPGRIYSARIAGIPRGVGQGQVAVSGVLARSGSVSGVGAYPAVVSIPEGYDERDLRLGMPGTATVFSPNAGVIGMLKHILVWIGSYAAFL